jgi:hypothetical protein
MLKNIFHKITKFFKRRKTTWRYVVMAFFILLPLEFFLFSSKNTISDEAYWKSFLENNKVYSILVPKNLEFAGERVPLYDFTVIESMERELIVNTYFHSQTLLMLKRANRWLPRLAEILKKNGIPDDFKYIPLVESNLTNSISPKGAVGYWQFAESAARQYGLEVNDEVDERYHLEKSTEAACRYFKEAYQIFGNWTLSAASYNMGINALKKQMEKQKATSYYDLSLNEETARYIFRILAVKEILTHPHKYGYQLRKKDLYPPIETQRIKIDSSIADFSDFAAKNNVSYKIFKYFNPWLRANSLTNKERKTYYIELPQLGYNEEYLGRLAEFDTLYMEIDSSAVINSFVFDSLNKQ